MIEYVIHLPVAQLDSASDSDSEGQRFESARAGQKTTSLWLVVFLSKPQAWHIIAARSAVYIIKGGKPPLYLITL